MYTLTVNANEEIFIKTPNVKSMKDIKTELKQTEDCIINHSVYPDGTDVTFTQIASKIIISSNKKLVKHDDGNYYFEN